MSKSNSTENSTWPSWTTAALLVAKETKDSFQGSAEKVKSLVRDSSNKLRNLPIWNRTSTEFFADFPQDQERSTPKNLGSVPPGDQKFWGGYSFKQSFAALKKGSFYRDSSSNLQRNLNNARESLIYSRELFNFSKELGLFKDPEGNSEVTDASKRFLKEAFIHLENSVNNFQIAFDSLMEINNQVGKNNKYNNKLTFNCKELLDYKKECLNFLKMFAENSEEKSLHLEKKLNYFELSIIKMKKELDGLASDSSPKNKKFNIFSIFLKNKILTNDLSSEEELNKANESKVKERNKLKLRLRGTNKSSNADEVSPTLPTSKSSAGLSGWSGLTRVESSTCSTPTNVFQKGESGAEREHSDRLALAVMLEFQQMLFSHEGIAKQMPVQEINDSLYGSNKNTHTSGFVNDQCIQEGLNKQRAYNVNGRLNGSDTTLKIKIFNVLIFHNKKSLVSPKNRFTLNIRNPDSVPLPQDAEKKSHRFSIKMSNERRASGMRGARYI